MTIEVDRINKAISLHKLGGNNKEKNMGGGGLFGIGGGGGKGVASVSPAPVVDQSALNRQAEEEEAKAIEESNEEARLAALQEQGREGTILTGSLGATSNANVRTKTLLGQ